MRTDMTATELAAELAKQTAKRVEQGETMRSVVGGLKLAIVVSTLAFAFALAAIIMTVSR